MRNSEHKLKSDDIDLFFEAILKLENIDECYNFFEDVATINELKALSQRITVAKMLSEKKVYTEIAEETKASTATISRVNKCLNYGAGGYELILKRISK